MPNSLIPADMTLEPNLNLMAAAPLAQKLTEKLNSPVELNAADVSHIDQPCLQILIAAARQWQSSGVDFQITNMSEGFLECLKSMGLSPSIFTNEDFA